MQGIANSWMWAGFAAFVVIAIVVDLVALEKKGAHQVRFKEALYWSLLWVGMAMLFNVLLWFWLDQTAGRELANLKATEFLTGYLIEKSLSVDNIFVFLMIFGAFNVPLELQKRALIIGIIGAVVLRGILILVGAWLISQFSWLLYLFGAFLVFTGIRMMLASEEEPDLENNPLLRWMRGHLTLTAAYHDSKLWFMRDGQRWFTPLFVVVILIGITDVIFAVDSIPAIFAITTDPFIVMTSNIFAILGLRAMFFLLAGLADRFHLLKYGLAVVLCFIGTKMLIVQWFHVPVFVSLGAVALILAVSMGLSVITSRHAEHKARREQY